jgi:UDP-glucose:(glucosyl)LPS alpha-1,2-glucosyltransferase
MAFVEENEISAKSQGGTEITKRSIGKKISEELAADFQIIPSRVRDLQEDKIRVYWAHDMAEDPECAHFKQEHSRNRFHKMVFSSNWQMNDWSVKLGIPLTNKLQVIETPIEPYERVEKPTDQVNLIYFSTPHRGLELLVPVVDVLKNKHPNVHLHVFSSFKIYGWEDADKHFEPLYDQIKNHPNMTYHGFAPQETLKDTLLKCHILAYPSIWQETSCRVLMESMSAGLLCVHPNLAALPDTAGGMTFMYQFDQDPKTHAEIFYKYLDRAVEDVNKPEIQNYLRFQKAYADARFNLDKISTQWQSLMVELKEQYPTVESRKLPQEMFTYKTP